MGRQSCLKAIALSFAGMLLVGCGSDATAPSEVGTISLLVVSGGGQSGVVGTELPQPLVIKATNSKGAAIADLTVNFRVTSGGGSVFAGVASTDTKGLATDYWTLGTSTAQAQQVEVRAVLSNGQKQVFGTFTATPLPGPPAHIAIQAGNGQTANDLSAIPIAPAVLVSDQFGNPVPNVIVTFVPAGGSGSVTGNAPSTDANGIATAGAWVLGMNTGTSTSVLNTLTATAAGNGIAGNPVTFTATSLGNVWATRASMSNLRTALGVGGIGGTLYAIGGANYINGTLATVEAYDPANDTWAPRASMATARYGLGVATINGKLYAVGGCCDNGNLSATVEEYDPATDTWTQKASMPSARYFLGVAAVNGKLYAVGGYGISGALAAVEEYDPATDTWTSRQPMPTARYALSLGAINGILYAVGGADGNSVLGTVEAYDPATDTWATTVLPMPTARLGLGVVAVNGMLYAVGGGSQQTDINYAPDLATVEAYDPIHNTWTTQASMPTSRKMLGVAAINGLLYAVGGKPLGNFNELATVEAYQP